MRTFYRLALTFCILLSICDLRAAEPATEYAPHVLGPSLRSQAADRIRAQDYAGAAILLERWLEADPRDGRAWSTLAQVYAAEGSVEKALDAFERSVDAGFADIRAVDDKGFDPIRSEPRFITAVARIEARAQAAQEAQVPRGYVSRTAPMRSHGTYIVMLPPDYDSSGRKYPPCASSCTAAAGMSGSTGA